MRGVSRYGATHVSSLHSTGFCYIFQMDPNFLNMGAWIVNSNLHIWRTTEGLLNHTGKQFHVHANEFPPIFLSFGSCFKLTNTSDAKSWKLQVAKCLVVVLSRVMKPNFENKNLWNFIWSFWFHDRRGFYELARLVLLVWARHFHSLVTERLPRLLCEHWYQLLSVANSPFIVFFFR